jgi:hypothetical protein
MVESVTYPSTIDELTDGVPSDGAAPTTALDNATFPHDDHHRNLAVAVEAVETELGTDPSGAATTVKDRLTGSGSLALAPTGALAETVPRDSVLANQAANIVSGTLKMTSINLPAGTTVTSISVMSATQAAVAPTNWWFGLFDSSRLALRLTADQLTAAWAANTVKTVNLTSTFQTTYSGLHYIGVMVAAGTVPSMWAVVSQAVPNGVAPIRNGSSDAGLTTPPALPFTATAITATGGLGWWWVS